MSTVVEKNDVNTARLFYYGDKFKIEDRNGKEVATVYIRLVGDSELNRAKTFALRRSADLRIQLKEEGSETRLAYVLDNYEEVTNEELISLIVGYSYQRLAKEAFDSVSTPVPVEPRSDDGLEEQEKYQKEIDDYPLKRMTQVKAHVDELAEKLKEELTPLAKEELIKKYESLLIATMCEQEMLNKFREMCAYFGCYKDKNYKERVFNSFEDFDNALPDIKKQIINYYFSLELTTDELKK